MVKDNSQVPKTASSAAWHAAGKCTNIVCGNNGKGAVYGTPKDNQFLAEYNLKYNKQMKYVVREMKLVNQRCKANKLSEEVFNEFKMSC